MKITHLTGKTDSRYKVAPVARGVYPVQHTAVFCGDYIGQAATDWQAWLICAEHKAKRIGGYACDYLTGMKQEQHT